MARYPVIESPCPIADKPLPVGASEHCSLCERSVHNLDLMSEAARRNFMRACSGKVCVAYTMRIPAGKLPVRNRKLVAATLAAAGLAATPLAASESAGEAGAPPGGQVGGEMSPLPGAQPALPNCDEYYEYIIVGGVSHGDQAEWVDDGKDTRPELPTMEDDGR